MDLMAAFFKTFHCLPYRCKNLHVGWTTRFATIRVNMIPHVSGYVIRIYHLGIKRHTHLKSITLKKSLLAFIVSL